MRTHTIRIAHRNITLYLKARRLGWVTAWTGEGVICMTKDSSNNNQGE